MLLVALHQRAHHALGHHEVGFVNPQRLEAAVEGLFFFNKLTVLFQGGRPNHRDLAAGQFGLEQVGRPGAHRSFRIKQ